MKKIPLLCILSFVFCIGITFAYSSEDTSNANYLADQQIVVKQTTASKYRLDDKILRQEVIGMALKVKGITLPENYTCKKYFADATKNDWVCRAVELAADNGIITRSNKYANPGKDVTRAEALAMIIAQYNIDPFPEVSPEGNTWQQEVARKYIGIGVQNRSISDGFTIKDVIDGMGFTAQWRPNSLATRAEVFAFTKNILSYESDGINSFEQCESLNFIVPGPCQKSEGNGGNDIITYWKTGGEESNQCTIYFMDGTSINNISLGTPKYEKYGEYDVISLFRNGQYEVSRIFAEGGTFTLHYSGNIGDCPVVALEGAKSIGKIDVLVLYYRNIGSTIRDGNSYSKPHLRDAYFMRSPAGVSLATFESWYKNTESVTFREDTLKTLGDNTYEFLVDMTENGVKSTYKVKSRVNLENFTIDNISSVKQ